MENSIVFDSHIHVGVTPKEYLFGEDLIKKMDKNNQDCSLIFPMMRGFEFSPARFNLYSGNEYIDNLTTANKGRLYGIMGIDPRFIKNSLDKKHDRPISSPVLEEVDYFLNKPNFYGVKLHPTLHNFSIDDPVLVFPLLDKIIEIQKKTKKKILILVHCAGDFVNNTPEKLAVIAEKYKDLFFAASHIGDFWGMDAFLNPNNNMILKNNNIFIDYTVFNNEPIFIYIYKTFGPSRIFLGSNEPFGNIEIKMEFIKRVDIPERDKKIILGSNLFKFLNN